MPTSSEPQGCLAAILRLFGIRMPEPKSTGDLPYRVRDDFLSPAELLFYRVLRLAVKDRATVLTKVNLADVFFVTRPKENQSYRNKIAQKHVDFLLCDSESMKPLVGIELDDASHQRGHRVQRDHFVEQVFQAAGLSLVRVPARPGYDPKALASDLAPHLGSGPVAPLPTHAAIPGSSQPVCPKCAVPMLPRVVSKGENKGKQFWGCPNYPRCREIA